MYKISSSTTSAPHGRASSSTKDDEGRVKKGIHHQNALPPLFYYMEKNEWEKAAERAKRHPREVKTWATLRTKSTEPGGEKSEKKISGAKRLALHHACFKLRSSVSFENGFISTGSGDPFMLVCKFILLLLEIYPEAAEMRESRHGCLPLHLAAFASCTRPSQPDDASAVSSAVSPVRNTYSWGSVLSKLPSPVDAGAASGGIPKPSFINRSASESTTDTIQTNISAVLAEEHYTGSQTLHRAATPSKKHRRSSSASSARVAHVGSPTVSVSMSSNILISEKREEMAVRVLNALLDAYPRGIRMDSEGGRLPLHTACAGRATPRVISTLVTAYPAAARHRNRDGFLPLREFAWNVLVATPFGPCFCSIVCFVSLVKHF